MKIFSFVLLSQIETCRYYGWNGKCSTVLLWLCTCQHSSISPADSWCSSICWDMTHAVEPATQSAEFTGTSSPLHSAPSAICVTRERCGNCQQEKMCRLSDRVVNFVSVTWAKISSEKEHLHWSRVTRCSVFTKRFVRKGGDLVFLFPFCFPVWREVTAMRFTLLVSDTSERLYFYFWRELFTASDCEHTWDKSIQVKS